MQSAGKWCLCYLTWGLGTDLYWSLTNVLCTCCTFPADGNRRQLALMLHMLIWREPLVYDTDVDFPGGLEAISFFLDLQVPPCTCCACPAHGRPGHAHQQWLLIHGWRLTCSRVGRASGSLDSIHEIKPRTSVKKKGNSQLTITRLWEWNSRFVSGKKAKSIIVLYFRGWIVLLKIDNVEYDYFSRFTRNWPWLHLQKQLVGLWRRSRKVREIAL